MADGEIFTLRHLPSGRLVARRLVRPSTFWKRNLGLLVHPPLQEGEGLWIDPCGGVHTWGMRYAIDVLFLDEQLRVVGAAQRLTPWRTAFAPRGTRSVVELRVGSAAGVARGDRMALEATAF